MTAGPSQHRPHAVTRMRTDASTHTMHQLLMDARTTRSTSPSAPDTRGFAAGSGGEGPTSADEASWHDENRRGLAFAATDAWDDAAEAFSAAADSLSRNEARDPAVHDALALVLANMGQACFRAGRTDDAIRHAQRACALRVALCGEDAVAVARSRSDLAVILAASGRIDEAPTLVARAIAGIEQSVGDEDLRLAVVLENAARVALAAGQPATAEPFLLRLHGLLGAHEMSTDRADMLLARVFEARVDADARSHISAGAAIGAVDAAVDAGDDAAVDAGDDAAVDAPADSSPDTAHRAANETAGAFALDAALDAPHEMPHAADTIVPDEAGVEAPSPAASSVAGAAVALPAQDDSAVPSDPDTEWEDQPLRDAVVLTHALLRSTPTGNPVVRMEQSAVDPWSAPASAPPVPHEAFEPVDPLAGVEDRAMPEGHPEAAALDGMRADETEERSDVDVPDDDIFGANALELTDALVRPQEPASAAAESALSGIAAEGAEGPPPASTGGLGFVVQYGVPLESGSYPAMGAGITPLPERAADTADTAPATDRPGALNLGSELELVPEASMRPGDSVPRGASPEHGALTAPLNVPLVPPVNAGQSVSSRDAGASAERGATPHGPALRPTVHTLDAIAKEPRAAPRTPRVAKPTEKNSRAGLIGGGIAALAALAAAGWYYMNGGF